MTAIPSVSVPVSGHFWTIAPNLFPSLARTSDPFTTTVEDPFMGSVRLTGLFEDVPGADTVALIVHGFAGNAGSPYCGFAARSARAAGYASLRLSLRGADLTGEDIYHGGLTGDLAAALHAPELKKYANVMLIGYSVGGCLALRAAIEKIDPRIRGVVAVCSPIDIEAGADAFDAPERSFYRQQVFNGLNRVYAATDVRRGLPTPTDVVRRARTTRERDELAVIPRFGYSSVAEYYREISVSNRIEELDIPSLLVLSDNDPVVPAFCTQDAIARAPKALTTIHVPSGGHIYFPRDLDLGQGGALGLEPQVLRWLTNHC